MKLATTTEDFQVFCQSYRESIDCICEAGFKNVDISFYNINKSEELLGDARVENARRLKEYADSKGISFVQAHSPGGNPLAGGVIDEEIVKYTVRSIEVCQILGIPNIVVHSGMNQGWTKDDFFENNLKFYSRLFGAMETTGVNVLTENSTKANMGDMYWTNTGADMKEFLQFADHPLLHACWDTGHGNCEGSQYDELIALGEDLYALHINDNLGASDQHIIPYLGTVNMDDVMHGLLDVGYKGVFTFECSSVLRRSKCWLGHRRSFERDNRLAEPTIEMQKITEKLMYEVGRHVLASYECFEE